MRSSFSWGDSSEPMAAVCVWSLFDDSPIDFSRSSAADLIDGGVRLRRPPQADDSSTSRSHVMGPFARC